MGALHLIGEAMDFVPGDSRDSGSAVPSRVSARLSDLVDTFSSLLSLSTEAHVTQAFLMYSAHVQGFLDACVAAGFRTSSEGEAMFRDFRRALLSAARLESGDVERLCAQADVGPESAQAAPRQRDAD